jgi:flagellar basal-body rod modification protein FlgD
MASIGNVAAALYHAQQASNTGSSSSATGTGSSPSSSSNSPTAASDPLANQSTFLQLLVAQLKNQNPMNPMDGTTFVTQLAQFSDLEQNLAMRQDLDAIDNKYTGSSSIPSTAQASSGSQQTSQSTATNQTSQSNPTAGVSNSNQTGLF